MEREDHGPRAQCSHRPTSPPPPLPLPLPHAAGAGEGSAEPVSARPGGSTEAESQGDDAPSGEGTGKEVTCVPAGGEYEPGSAEVCGVQGQGGSSKGCQASTGVWVSYSRDRELPLTQSQDTGRTGCR